jgi:chlorobactene glucosyltransferase
VTPALWFAAIAAALWCGGIVVVVVRFADSQRLDAYPPLPREQTPLISVIIPARDEARNIEACLRSVLASDYGNLDVIVVDDHSADGTGAIAQRVADEDAAKQGRTRARVIQAPALPEGWFGKQWACQFGADVARGEILCFTDADTRHGPQLLSRSAGAMRSRGAHLFTVAGAQDAESFWEKVLQPFVFSILLSRYGGLEQMSRSTNPYNKIANGQFVMMTRNTYAQIGGHAAVRDHVAEDLRLAQVVTERGLQAHMVLARDHMSTRMYHSLGEIRRGWGKNIFAAGRDTLRLGALGQRVFPWIFPLPALVPLIPTAVFVLWAIGVLGPAAMLFGAVAGGFNLLFFIGVYAYARVNPLWGLLHPLAAVMFSFICAEAAWRGSNVEWKGRGYISRKAS